jgi:hypothetical protein
MMPAQPDFFFVDNQDKLIYRGQLDDSRPGNGIPLSGNDLRGAIDGGFTTENQPQSKPSMGCNIKWSSGVSKKTSSFGFFYLC